MDDEARRRAAYETERRASMERIAAATTYMRATMAADPEALRERIAEAKREIAPLQARREALQREIRLLEEQFLAAHEVLAETVLAAMGGETDWSYLLDSSNVGGAASTAWVEATWKFGLVATGSWESTGQRAVTIALHKDHPRSLERTAEGLRTLMPHMRPHADGWLRFRVLDNTDAASADELLVSPDGTRARLSRGRAKPVDFGGLDAALAYVQENHWNERAEDVYQEDEPSPSFGPG